MSSALQLLEVVDAQGNVVGWETRLKIHAQGLLHREVYVWFYTRQGEVIFQHRSPTKDTYPNLLDATVGGHVALGEDYLAAALREMEEETGVQVQGADLRYLWTFHHKSPNPSHAGLVNNALRAVYVYCYRGNIADLRIEERAAVGFEVWPLEKLFHLNKEEQQRFIPLWMGEHGMKVFKKIQELTV